jgi:hypothetical protein
VAAHPDGDGTRIDVRMVVSPGAGTFRPGPVAEVTAEGEIVRPGDVLGHVEGSGRHQPVESFCHGFLVRLMVEAGERVRTGQPVAWVHPFDGIGAGA